MPQHYLGTDDIAAWFGVQSRTITTWLHRYPDCPQPDAVTGSKKPVSGWLPQREQAWRDWEASRRGQGWRANAREGNK